jgi:hypothetical protein
LPVIILPKFYKMAAFVSLPIQLDLQHIVCQLSAFVLVGPASGSA